MLSSEVAPNAASGADAFVLPRRFHEIAVDAAQIRHHLATASFSAPDILRCANDGPLMGSFPGREVEQ